MTHLTADTTDWTLWAWMLVLGLGIGPSMAGFTVVVQSFVPMHRLGVASSTLTFLRQMGASIGLAVAGTVFSSSFQNQLPSSLADQGVPQQAIGLLLKLSGALQGVGDRAGLLSHLLPPPLRPLIPHILAGVDDAFAKAVGSIFWITLAAGSAALLFTLVLRDLELKQGRPGPGGSTPVGSGRGPVQTQSPPGAP